MSNSNLKLKVINIFVTLIKFPPVYILIIYTVEKETLEGDLDKECIFLKDLGSRFYLPFPLGL